MNEAAPVKHLVAKYSVRIAGHATSVSLEPAFWAALCEIAARRGIPVNTLLAAIDAERSGNLSSAIRLFVLESCRRGELVSKEADLGPIGYGMERKAHRELR
jgi:predicted DNA-binding ribbon-helix-helix protein